MEKNEVSTAFDILLLEIEKEIQKLRNEGSNAFQNGSYDAAKNFIEKAAKMSEFHQNVNGLHKDWKVFIKLKRKVRKIKTKPKKVNVKLKHGLRTPESYFREPILKAISEMGGAGKIDKVLERVERIMKGTLNEHDRQTLRSYPHEMRWKNTAQWARFKLIKEGLLSRNAKRGIWEITDKGSNWIKSRKIFTEDV